MALPSGLVTIRVMAETQGWSRHRRARSKPRALSPHSLTATSGSSAASRMRNIANECHVRSLPLPPDHRTLSGRSVARPDRSRVRVECSRVAPSTASVVWRHRHVGATVGDGWSYFVDPAASFKRDAIDRRSGGVNIGGGTGSAAFRSRHARCGSGRLVRSDQPSVTDFQRTSANPLTCTTRRTAGDAWRMCMEPPASVILFAG